MAGLIITSYIVWLAGFFVTGFNLYNCCIVITTTMFALKKVGVFVKLSNVITWEVVFMIFSVGWRLIFRKFYIGKFLIVLLLRAIFIAINVYDNKVYVYVNKESRVK